MRTLNSLNTSTETKRSAIVKAAMECFVEMGYTQATIEKIREYSGVSNGSLYHHFKCKEELAAAVYLEGITNYQEGISDILLKETSAETGVKAIVGYHLNWVNENKSWATFLFNMRSSDLTKDAEGALSHANERFYKLLNNWLKKQKVAGAIKDISSSSLLPLILGPCQEFSRLWLSGTLKTSLARAITDISEGVWRSVQA
ncbi:MAG: TetR/AcrR family transcriptional regulator [bacterium]